MATVLKSQGYATGQFGKNHQGDRDEHLPTMHGFDEFLGNLYHLNAEEEPENRDYPGDMVLANGKTFRRAVRPSRRAQVQGRPARQADDRGHRSADQEADGDDRRGNPGRRKGLHQAPARGRQAVLLLVERHPHALPHAREGGAHGSQRSQAATNTTTAWSSTTCTSANCSTLLDELGIADNTIVLYSTDNGPHYNTWPDAGTTPFRGEKNSNWEGAYRVPAFVRWPGKFPAGVTLNGIVAHEDWLPTFAAAAGAPDIKEKLRKAWS